MLGGMLLGSALLAATPSTAQTAIIGITETDQVFRIASAAAPTVITAPIAITGLTAGQTVAGADYRPNTGELYILGYNSASSTGQLYVLNPTTGVAVSVGTSMTLSLGAGSIGFDFNPTVDRIRVVGANRKNYRLHPVTGAIAATDGDLAYATGDANAAQTPSVGAVAYTNSYIGSETTSLYDYDESLNIIALQSPPNNGTLNTIGASTITVNAANRTVDMDIVYDPATGGNTAYLAANTGTSTADNLYTINLTTGATTLVGGIGVLQQVKDIAVVIDRTVPANVTGKLVYGLTRVNRNLVSFDTDAPGTIRGLMSITGLTAGQSIVGMDMRPATMQLYAMGYNATDSSFQLYTINPTTAAATAVGPGTNKLTLGTGNVGFDFNPTVDRIRVVGANGMNYRIHPDIASVTVDTMLAYLSSDPAVGRTPRVGTVAYTNSFKGSTTTQLFGIDDSTGSFVRVMSPNGGTLSTINPVAYMPNTADQTSDLDFFYDSTAMTNIGYLVANTVGTSNDNLYIISTASGVTTNLGKIGGGVQLMDIAVQQRYTGPTNVGVASVKGLSSLQAYPNPMRDVLQVQAEGRSTATIMDATGRVVRTVTGNGTIQINTEGLAAGLYLLRLEREKGLTGTAKLVKE